MAGSLRYHLAAALAVVVVATPAVALGADDAPPPAQWPANSVVNARLEGWPNAVRFAGTDRYQTNLAVALALRGHGDYPFDTPDRSSVGASVLGTAGDWWGAGTCPRSIIVTVGDTPADSLGASALSDPTHNSTEPLLQRTAAADPLFDPVGGMARVDTDSAPIIITTSARQGATQLSPPARLAANDLRRGGCTTARQAIVVGGTAAVPAGVDSELLSLGYREVFRVAGANRFDTAARIASALSTENIPSGDTTCADPDTTDGARQTFYANAAVELRDSPTTCKLLIRSVVLADGLTGADALAAGWWTSFWQVPVLLHDGSDTLPAATANALVNLPISNLIVLGGTSRISDAVATEAKNLSGAATVTRIAGGDRYDTSVLMAERFGGWWPTGNPAAFDSSMFCIAASAGSGSDSTGWPDALGAGPLCAALGGAASNPGPPTRALPTVAGPSPSLTTATPVRPAHDAVPILLVPTGSRTLPPAVATLLSGVFPPTGAWCSSQVPVAMCAQPGFAVTFGGDSVVPPQLVDSVSLTLGGGSGQLGPIAPIEAAAPFATALDMSPVYDVAGSGSERVCAPRGSYIDARWLAVYGDNSAARSIGENDAMIRRRYLTDADNLGRSPFVGAPICAAYTPPGTAITARLVGPAGRVGPVHDFDITGPHRVQLSTAISGTSPFSTAGTLLEVLAADGTSTTERFDSTSPVTLTMLGSTITVLSSTAEFVLIRPTDLNVPYTFTATFTLVSPQGTVTGTADGEAMFVAGAWQLRGESRLTGGTWGSLTGSGGFSATLSPVLAGQASDDTVRWQVDGTLS